LEGKGFTFFLIIILVFLSITLAGLAGYVLIGGGGKAPAATNTGVQAETTKIPADSELATYPLFEGTKNFNLKNENSNQLSVMMVSVEMKYFLKVKGIKDTKIKIDFYKSEISELIGTYFQNMTIQQVELTNAKANAGVTLKKQINELLKANEAKKADITDIVYNISFPLWFYQ
jgi:flagellar basal body-associated protein FliL